MQRDILALAHLIFARCVGILSPEAEVDADNFLLEEGLDLLAAYRAIDDRETPTLIKNFIDAVVETQARSLN